MIRFLQHGQFVHKRMHRKSSIFAPVVEYLANNEESHTTKIKTLINQYESVLQKSSSENIFLDIVDTFIAL